MKRIVFLILIFASAKAATAQHGLAVYPFENKLGYRSNLNKRGFWDLKAGGYLGGATVLTPDVEINRIWRKKSHLDSNVRFYSGFGLSFFFIVPGVVVPIGIEAKLTAISPRLVLIAEANPRFDLFGTGVFQASLRGHFGIAYHFGKK